MKAVLMSIQPKWCELIASGKKTVEVRKTKPKLDVPFKVYIYCTKGKPTFTQSAFCDDVSNGKVVGEFVCDAIFPISCYYSDPNARFVNREQPYTCLTDKEMIDYLGNGVEGYGWHITDLVIYDKPRELGEFIVPSKIGCCNEGKCRGCKYLDRGNGFNIEDDCNAKFCTDEYKPLRRPPQSWCYVEEVNDGT